MYVVEFVPCGFKQYTFRGDKVAAVGVLNFVAIIFGTVVGNDGGNYVQEVSEL